MQRIKYEQPLNDEEFEFPSGIPVHPGGQIVVTSEYGQFVYAWQYRDAARIVYSFNMPERISRNFSPLFNIIGQCLESSFKSYCISKGVNEKWLKEMNNRHNLFNLMTKSSELGLNIDQYHKDVIADLSPNFGDHLYRYGPKPPKGSERVWFLLPDVNDLMRATDDIVRLVADAIGMIRASKP